MNSCRSRLRIVRYREDLRLDWNHAVREARNGLFFFEREFLDYHGPRFSDCSLMLYAGRNVLALLPAHRDGDALVSHLGLPFAGWLVAPALCLRHMQECFVLLEEFLRANGLGRFVVSPVPSRYAVAPCEEELWCLRQVGATEVTAKASVAMRPRDFRKLATESRGRMLAREVFLSCRVVATSNTRLHMERTAEFLHRRHQTQPLHTAEDMEFLAAAFPQNIRIWEVWRGDHLVGGLLAFVTHRVIRPQHMFVCGGAERMGGAGVLNGAILLLEEIKDCHWDFGTSMDPASGQLDPTLHQFKESHGGRIFIQSTYEWHLES